MRGAHRPSLPHSLRNAHADIETPSWRRYVPNCDSSSDANLSDDDTTAEAYINTYQDLALEERRRWAGAASTNPPSTPNTTPRPRAKLSSKHNIPWFPTPTEAFHLVRSALNAFQQKTHPIAASKSQDVLSHQAHVLEALETTLACFAEVEEKLRSAKTRLKAAVNAHAYHRAATENGSHQSVKRTLPDFTMLYPFSLNTPLHREPSPAISPHLYQPNRTLDHSAIPSVSQPSTPPLPSKASPLLTKDSIAMIINHARSKADLIEEVFRLETSAMQDDIRRLALQAQIPVPESASFQAISAAITRALRSHRAAKGEEQCFSSKKTRKDSETLENLIRREIDAERYPLLARSFQLDADYCLDGTRRSIVEVARSRSNGPGPDQTERKPWEGLHLLEPQITDESARRERRPWGGERMTGSRARQEPTEFVNGNGIVAEPVDTKKATSFVNDNDLVLTRSTFQTARLDARRKLRQNVKRKLPRIHKERRTKKAFRFRDSAESISSRSSGASSASPRWTSFREDGTETMAIARKPSVTVQFQQVVDLDDKEDGTEPSVVYLDDEG